MNLLLKLLSSPWFWADVVLSITGGIIVYWGLSIEKRAERRMPPSDFREDIFEDVIEVEKSELERGWRILMLGIFIEVVAALGISVISSLEIAELNDKAEQAGKDAAASLLEAKLAETNAAASNERAAKFDADRVMVEKEAEEIRSTNFELQAKVLKLEAKQNWRTISDKQIEIFTNELILAPKNNLVSVYSLSQTIESGTYTKQIKQMLNAAGYPFNKARDENATVGNASLDLYKPTDASVFLMIGTNSSLYPPRHILDIKFAFDAADIRTAFISGHGIFETTNDELVIGITERR